MPAATSEKATTGTHAGALRWAPRKRLAGPVRRAESSRSKSIRKVASSSIAHLSSLLSLHQPLDGFLIEQLLAFKLFGSLENLSSGPCRRDGHLPENDFGETLAHGLMVFEALVSLR